jgi:3-oxoacyl-[acyl-carrier protein] reductase
MQIKGCSAIVTGAGRGIGRATALALAERGANVVLVARTASEIEATADGIAAKGGSSGSLVADLLNPSPARAAVKAAVDSYGGLQVLVNNAGVAHHTPFGETTDAEWEATLGTNLTAVFRLTREALPELQKQGGHVFMISSLAGVNPIAGLSAYCASKAALDQLAACLMLEVRQTGVKVTTLAPGSVDTTFGGGARTDASWMLKPEDLALTIVHLLESRDEAHLSRIEMRPSRPPKRG